MKKKILKIAATFELIGKLKLNLTDYLIRVDSSGLHEP